MPPPGTRTPFRSATCVRSRRRHRVQLGCAVSANDRRELQHVIDDAATQHERRKRGDAQRRR
eukprot:1624964-Prymnesium_polylepis.1